MKKFSFLLMVGALLMSASAPYGPKVNDLGSKKAGVLGIKKDVTLGGGFTVSGFSGRFNQQNGGGGATYFYDLGNTESNVRISWNPGAGSKPSNIYIKGFDYDPGSPDIRNNDAFISENYVYDRGYWDFDTLKWWVFYGALPSGYSTAIKFRIYDVTKPTVNLSPSVSNGSWIKNNVSINYSDNRTIRNAEVRNSNAPDKDIWSGKTFSKEGYYDIYVTDQSGNTTNVWFHIDKTQPVMNVSTVGEENYWDEDYHEFTNKDVLLTYSDNSGINSAWKDNKSGYHNAISSTDNTVANNHVYTEEGSYFIRTQDYAGNSSHVMFTIDKTAPRIKIHPIEPLNIKDPDKPDKTDKDHMTHLGEDESEDITYFGEDEKNILYTANKQGVRISIEDWIKGQPFSNFGLGYEPPAGLSGYNALYINGERNSFQNNFEITQEGKYVLELEDLARNKTTVTIIIDRTAPKISGSTI